MTREEADKAQEWAGMDGATAWHLIDRHANDWREASELMNAWLRANVLAEREGCAEVCDAEATAAFEEGTEDWARGACMCATAIRARSGTEGT